MSAYNISSDKSFNMRIVFRMFAKFLKDIISGW